MFCFWWEEELACKSFKPFLPPFVFLSVLRALLTVCSFVTATAVIFLDCFFFGRLNRVPSSYLLMIPSTVVLVGGHLPGKWFLHSEMMRLKMEYFLSLVVAFLT